jgi:hypothetical protein
MDYPHNALLSNIMPASWYIDERGKALCGAPVRFEGKAEPGQDLGKKKRGESIYDSK